MADDGRAHQALHGGTGIWEVGSSDKGRNPMS
jgi:hypothetical protein